ncbi:MAG: choice-of-anchor L domain-containing protein, partial [Bacteroidales bacterium]|nr:choice-of-anchor L domain-containing protein [Bacteroidales bacterium]
MKTLTTTILLFLIAPLLVIAQQSNDTIYTSNHPETAIILQVEESPSFMQFHLSNNNNYELEDPNSLRAYYNQNHYFQFIMPEVSDIDVFLDYNNENIISGLAAYTIDGSGNYIFHDLQHITTTPGQFTIKNNGTLRGERIILRLWFSDALPNESYVKLTICKREPISQPKNINVNSSTYTPTELIQDILVTGCLEAFNVTYNGDPVSLGYFDGSIGSTAFNEGIILTSGSAALAEGPNSSGSTGHNSSGGSDPDLQALIPGYTINDAAILEFDFIPASDSLQFDFIFGSDEYPEWVASDYNDVFGFFLSGPGITGPYSNNSINIALIPGTTLPVTIDNINTGMNPAYYVSDSYGGDIEYDGATIPITAKATVQACETYHIKMAIGDAGDSSYDSGVFLNAKSFISGSDFVIDLFNPWYQTDETYEGCQNYAVFSRVDSTDTSQDINIGLSITGSATMGTDYSNIPDTVTIPAGQISDTLIIDTYVDGITEGNEFLIFTYTNGCPCTPVTSHDTIWIRDEIDAQINLTNSGPICEGDTANLSINFNPSLDLSLIDWTWQFNGSTQQSLDVSPSSSTTYTVEVNYPCTTEYYTTDLIVNENVDATITPVADMCENEPAITLTAADAGGTWSGNGVIGNTFNPAIAGSGNHLITYIISNTNCADTSTITIHVDEVLDPTIDPIEIQCRTDDAFLLTAATPGGVWTGPGVIGGQNLNPTSAGVGTHTIYYTLTNGACISIDSIQIEIVNDVDATIHTVANLCEIDPPIDLEANWHTGVWSGTGITDAALGIFDPAVAGPGDHEIEFQVGTGGTCSDDDTIIIHVNAMPDASISAPGPFCFPGDPVTLSANTAGGTWSGTGISDPVNGIFDPSLTGAGTTQVTYTVGSGACYDTDTIDITVNPAPTIDLGADQTHCDYDMPIALDAGAG